jgi:hypothetical protein
VLLSLGEVEADEGSLFVDDERAWVMCILLFWVSQSTGEMDLSTGLSQNGAPRSSLGVREVPQWTLRASARFDWMFEHHGLWQMVSESEETSRQVCLPRKRAQRIDWTGGGKNAHSNGLAPQKHGEIERIGWRENNSEKGKERNKQRQCWVWSG